MQQIPEHIAFTLSLLNKQFNKGIAFNIEDEQFYFYSRSNNEIIGKGIHDEKKTNIFGKLEDFYLSENVQNKPSMYRTSTVPVPSKNHTHTVPVPYTNNLLIHDISKNRKIENILIKGTNSQIIFFNKKRQADIISNTITDENLQKKAFEFENLILNKLTSGISNRSIRNTHNMYLIYINIINNKKVQNKVFQLDLLYNKLLNSVVLAKQESIRTNSRLNEFDKTLIQKENKKNIFFKIKIQIFSFLIVVTVLAAITYFLNLKYDFIPTLFNQFSFVKKIGEFKENKIFKIPTTTTGINDQKKRFTKNQVLDLIKNITVNKKISTWRKGYILNKTVNQEFTENELKQKIRNLAYKNFKK